MSVKEAIILAGGFGTRLKPVVSDVPKPMAPIKNRPFLEILIECFSQKGIQHFVISTGYRSEIIETYFKDKYDHIKISFSKEKEPLGTGGGIKLAMRKIIGDTALVMNGDTLFDVDLGKLDKFMPLKHPVIFGRKVSDVSRYGHFILDGEHVLHYQEKTGSGSGLINGGVYFLPKDMFDQFEIGQNFSLEKNIFGQFNESNPAHVIVSNSFFIDIGLPRSYQLAQNILENKWNKTN